MNLKETYNDFLRNKFNLLEIETERNKIISIIETELNGLERYNNTVTKEFENIGTSLLKLIERLIELKNNKINVPFDIEELIPGYKEWVLNGELLHKLSKQLKEIGHEPFISSHPVSILTKQALNQEHPINYIKQLAEQLEDLFEFISNELNKAKIPDNLKEHFLSIKELVNDAYRFKPYAENGNLFLYDSNHASTKQFEAVVYDYKELKNKVEQANKKNSNWKNKFSESDLQSAKEQLSAYQGSIFSFLNPGFWKLKKAIKSSYDFTKHNVKPGFKQVLDELQAEYSLINQSLEIEKKAEFTYKIKSITDTWNTIESFRKEKINLRYLI